MAVITLTGPVTRRDGDPFDTRKAQVAISAGQACYIDKANGQKFNLCDADLAASALFYGVAVGDTAIDEDLTVARIGSVITVANTPFLVGQVAYLSVTPGSFTVTWTDLLTGDFTTVALMPLSTSTALVCQVICGVVKA